MGLTSLQQRLLDFLRAYHAEHGTSPTFEEMALALGQTSKGNVHRILGCLEERGYIRRLRHRYRAIALMDDGAFASLPTALQQRVRVAADRRGVSPERFIFDAVAAAVGLGPADPSTRQGARP